MDYAEILTRMREETLKAHRAFLNKQVGKAEFCGYEMLRLAMQLIEAAEQFTDAQTRESAGKPKAA